MASEADRLRAIAVSYRNESLESRWTASGRSDLMAMAAQYEQAAALQEIADAINRTRTDKSGTS